MSRQLIRFLISGGSAAALEYGLFLLMTAWWSGQGLVFVAQTVSFMAGMVVSFGLNKYWSFQSTGHTGRQFVQYAGLAFLNIVLSNLVLSGLLALAVPALVAKLIVMAMVAAWNFVIFQRLIFGRAG